MTSRRDYLLRNFVIPFTTCMIDRYSIAATPLTLRERFSVEILHDYQPKYNAAPTNLLPVITNTAPLGLSNFYWGTSPEWAKNKTVSEKIINVHAETIQEKPALKRKLMKNRCIVPADGFFAWKKSGKKMLIPYRFVLKSTDLFSFAGLWEEYEDTDGVEFHTFTLITVASNALVQGIQERMPVILAPDGEKKWLSDKSTEAELMALLKPLEPEMMNLYSVSPGIQDTRINVPSLHTPVPPADQYGNLTLFD